MPSYLDLGLIVIILISALLAMLRGFTREVLAIASWGAAAIAAVYFYPLVLPYVKPYIQKDVVAMAASAAAVFFVTLILVSIITIKLSDAILDSKVGALDRSLGFLFGAARGLLLCVIAFVFSPGWSRRKAARLGQGGEDAAPAAEHRRPTHQPPPGRSRGDHRAVQEAEDGGPVDEPPPEGDSRIESPADAALARRQWKRTLICAGGGHKPLAFERGRII